MTVHQFACNHAGIREPKCPVDNELQCSMAIRSRHGVEWTWEPQAHQGPGVLQDWAEQSPGKDWDHGSHCNPRPFAWKKSPLSYFVSPVSHKVLQALTKPSMKGYSTNRMQTRYPKLLCCGHRKICNLSTTDTHHRFLGISLVTGFLLTP